MTELRLLTFVTFSRGPSHPDSGLEWVDPGSRCYCRSGPGRDEGYREEAEDQDKRHRHKNEAAQRR